MAKTVTVGCKLPHGIVLHHPTDPTKTVEIKGLNKSSIIGADHISTEVDEDFWNAWAIVNKRFPPLKAGSIFVSKSAPDAAAIAKELKDQKTGFEPMKQDGDERAKGVKTVKASDKD